MRIYDRRGMLVIPKPQPVVNQEDKPVILVKECFCQNGHNLVSNRVTFSNFDGIYLKVKNNEKEDFIGLSPVYGEKCRIALGVELVKDEIYEFYCPDCNEELPVFSPCHCGADIVTLFLNERGDYKDCIGICNRVDCSNSVVRNKGELIGETVLNSSSKRSGLFQSFLNLDNNGQMSMF